MSLPDTIFILLAALVLFGPKRLPEIMRQAGKILGELRRASNEFKFQIEEELRVSDEAERRRKAAAAEGVTPVPAALMTPLPQPPAPQPPATGTPVPRSGAEVVQPDGFVGDPQPPVAAEETAALPTAAEPERVTEAAPHA